MLQRVGPGQVRFNLPGLTADARGVVSGRQLAARFGTIERLVSFLRILSAGQNLDDVQGALRILYARAGGEDGAGAGPRPGTRETIVVLPNPSTHFADVVARAARTAGGQCFTGSGKHYVQFREPTAPFGFDAPAMSHAAGDLLLYGMERVTAYLIDSELPLQKLLLRLALRRHHGGERWNAGEGVRDLLFLTARRGLGPTLVAYLHRSQVHAATALCERTTEGVFGGAGSFWLFRIENLPARMIGLACGTPGLEIFRPVCPNVAVAAGYRHPVHLDACKSIFPQDQLYLFSPQVAGATVVAPLPTLVSLEDLVRIPDPPAEPPARVTRPGRPQGLTVPLRLEAFPQGARRAVATLIPWNQVPWLKKLCYALPPSTLRGYRVALIDRGALVIASGVLDGIPFGALLDATAPGVLVPLGTRLRPAISPELLASRLGATAGSLVVFPAAGAPFSVAADRIEPLERRTVAEIDVASADPAPGAPARPAEPAPIEIRNEALGPMPLWGLK